MFVYCYFGERLTESLEAISDAVYIESAWHNLPPQLRRHLLMMMRTAQQNRELKAFGLSIMSCRMWTFAEVVTTKLPFARRAHFRFHFRFTKRPCPFWLFWDRPSNGCHPSGSSHSYWRCVGDLHARNRIWAAHFKHRLKPLAPSVFVWMHQMLFNFQLLRQFSCNFQSANKNLFSSEFNCFITSWLRWDEIPQIA